MAVGMRDVAAAAGVSVATVSNVLNQPDRVADATRTRVREAIERLGFVPNGSARQLRAGRSRTLGLVVPDISNPFFMEVARGVEDAALSHDYTVFLCNSDERPERESRHLNALVEQRVGGVLITPADISNTRLEVLRTHGIAAALLDRESDGLDMCSASVDDVRGGQIAAQHLIELGHERIAWVTGPDSIPQCRDRGEGLRLGVLKSDVHVETIHVPLMNSASGEQAVEELLLRENLPTAIFCANDLLALGVLRRLVFHGIRVPEQISVLGYDDIDFASAAQIPLSSIAQPAYQLGFSATELLLEDLDADNHAHQQVRFMPQLVARASTGPAPIRKAKG